MLAASKRHITRVFRRHVLVLIRHHTKANYRPLWRHRCNYRNHGLCWLIRFWWSFDSNVLVYARFQYTNYRVGQWDLYVLAAVRYRYTPRVFCYLLYMNGRMCSQVDQVVDSKNYARSLLRRVTIIRNPCNTRSKPIGTSALSTLECIYSISYMFKLIPFPSHDLFYLARFRNRSPESSAHAY